MIEIQKINISMVSHVIGLYSSDQSIFNLLLKQLLLNSTTSIDLGKDFEPDMSESWPELEVLISNIHLVLYWFSHVVLSE